MIVVEGDVDQEVVKQSTRRRKEDALAVCCCFLSKNTVGR
jgi:hypothetical protein